MQPITLKIGSAAGRDFPDPYTAWLSTPTDWVAADVSYIFEVYPDAEFTPTTTWNFTGRNLDASHGLVVRPATGLGFKNNVLNNALRYNPSNGVAVRFSINYATHIGVSDFVTIEGLQVKSSGNGAITGFSIVGSLGTGNVNNCLLEYAGSSSTARAVVLKNGSIQSSHIILTGVTSVGVYHASGSTFTPSAENVTVTRLTSLAAATKPAFDSDINGFKITNCAAFGCSAFSTRSGFVGSNNASDGAILFGTNNKTNLVYANQFVDTVNDFKVKAGSNLIDAGTTPSVKNTSAISGVRQQGTSADIGAWEYPSSIQAPSANVTNISITNQTIVITGTTTGNPTGGSAAINPSSVAYNSAVGQTGAIALSSGTFSVTFNNVKAGRYDFNFSVANAYYNIVGVNPLGSIDVVGPRALSLVQDDITDAQVLTIHGTVENATSGTVVIPSSASNPNVATQTASVSINTGVSPNTYTVSIALPAGSYDAPILTFTGAGGTSLPQAGTQSIVVVGPRALTVVQDPLDGQTLTIHGTVEKATSGNLIVPADTTNPNGATEQTATVTVNTSVTPNTYTVSVNLPAGNYGTPILTFSNYLGPSQPQAGTSAVYIMSFSGNPQAPMPSGGTVVADTSPPVMTGTLSITDKTSTGFTVSWTAATDDVGVAYYEVSTDGVNYSSVGNTLTYSTSTATPSTTYNVKVRAVDTSANRSTPLSATVITLPSADVVAPVMVGEIAISGITSTGCALSWTPATDTVGVVGYEYSINNGAYVDVGNHFTATLTGLLANTNYTTSLRAYDAAGNKALPITVSFKTAAYVSFTGFTPSSSRTINVQAATPPFTGGKWWTLTDPKKPRGLKDPDAVIDITFDWSNWLDDIGSVSISEVTFTLNGLSSVGTFSDGTKTTVFVAGGTAGSATAIACKIKTFTNPSRTEERTVYIDIAEE